MLIVCSYCSAAYEVPDSLLATRKTVRCTQCLREWRVEPPAPEREIHEREIHERDIHEWEIGAEREQPKLPEWFAEEEEEDTIRAAGLRQPGLMSRMPPSMPGHSELTELEAPGLGPASSVLATPARPDFGITPDLRPETQLEQLAAGTSIGAVSDDRRMHLLVATAWAASLVALMILGWAAYEWRGNVMAAWPPSERLYAALGLKPAQE